MYLSRKDFPVLLRYLAEFIIFDQSVAINISRNILAKTLHVPTGFREIMTHMYLINHKNSNQFLLSFVDVIRGENTNSS